MSNVDTDTMPLADVLIEAIRYPMSEAETWALGSPPDYALPAPLLTHRSRVIRELDERDVPGDPGPSTVLRIGSGVRTFSNALSQMKRRGGFNFADATCLLVSCSALSVDSAQSVIAVLSPLWAAGVQRQIVITHLARGDVTAAEEQASRVEYHGWLAWREVGRYHARRADTAAFLRGWSTYRAATDRNDMSELKAELITNVAIAEGWQAAVAVGRGPRFKAEWVYTSLLPTAERGDLAALYAILDGEAAGLLSEELQLSLLVTAVLIATGKNPDADHPALPAIVDRIIALDPAESKPIMRSRDTMLMRLWPAYGDAGTLRRARAATRTPRNRAQLTILSRDIPAPT